MLKRRGFSFLLSLIPLSGFFLCCLDSVSADQVGYERTLARQSASDNPLVTALVEKAPELSSITFRAPVKAHKFSPPWTLIDDFESSDGTLYVSYEPALPKGVTAGDEPAKLGVLSSGLVQPISLGVSALGIGFVGTFMGHPVVLAAPPARRFALIGSKAQPIALSTEIDDLSNSTNFHLHDGSTCQKGQIGSSSPLLSRRDGRSQVLVSQDALDRAFGGKIQADPLTFVCATFAGNDYVNVNGFLIFQIRSGGLQLEGRGRIWASGPHHIVMSSESLPSDPHPIYYLEATAP